MADKDFRARVPALAEAEPVSRLGPSGFDPAREKAPYGHMCRNPQLCAGKGYCPRDPTCGD